MSDRNAALSQRVLVVGDPFGRFLGIDEGERECSDALLGCQQDGVTPRAGHPEGRMRLLHRFGNNVARRHLDKTAIDPGERCFGHATEHDFETFEPRLPLGGGINQETTQFCFRS